MWEFWGRVAEIHDVRRNVLGPVMERVQRWRACLATEGVRFGILGRGCG